MIHGQKLTDIRCDRYTLDSTVISSSKEETNADGPNPEADGLLVDVRSVQKSAQKKTHDRRCLLICHK